MFQFSNYETKSGGGGGVPLDADIKYFENVATATLAQPSLSDATIYYIKHFMPSVPYSTMAGAVYCVFRDGVFVSIGARKQILVAGIYIINFDVANVNEMNGIETPFKTLRQAVEFVASYDTTDQTVTFTFDGVGAPQIEHVEFNSIDARYITLNSSPITIANITNWACDMNGFNSLNYNLVGSETYRIETQNQLNKYITDNTNVGHIFKTESIGQTKLRSTGQHFWASDFVFSFPSGAGTTPMYLKRNRIVSFDSTKLQITNKIITINSISLELNNSLFTDCSIILENSQLNAIQAESLSVKGSFNLVLNKSALNLGAAGIRVHNGCMVAFEANNSYITCGEDRKNVSSASMFTTASGEFNTMQLFSTPGTLAINSYGSTYSFMNTLSPILQQHLIYASCVFVDCFMFHTSKESSTPLTAHIKVNRPYIYTTGGSMQAHLISGVKENISGELIYISPRAAYDLIEYANYQDSSTPDLFLFRPYELSDSLDNGQYLFDGSGLPIGLTRHNKITCTVQLTDGNDNTQIDELSIYKKKDNTYVVEYERTPVDDVVIPNLVGYDYSIVVEPYATERVKFQKLKLMGAFDQSVKIIVSNIRRFKSADNVIIEKQIP